MGTAVSSVSDVVRPVDNMSCCVCRTAPEADSLLIYFALFAALYGLRLWIWSSLLAMTVQGWTKNQRVMTGDGGGVDYFFSPKMVGKAG